MITYLRLRVGGKPYDVAAARQRRADMIRRGRITTRRVGQRGPEGFNPNTMFGLPPKHTHASVLDEAFRNKREQTVIPPTRRFL